MGLSPQSSDKHGHWLDDELARNPSDENETPDPELWDTPGHDGIVTDAETDPDRTDLRSKIGQYVSLVTFPAKVKDLIAMAADKDAPDEVLTELRRLDPGTTYPNTAELWAALGLSSEHRF
jgi:hypothetical protein